MTETGAMGIEQKRKDDWVGRITAVTLVTLMMLPLLAMAWLAGAL